MVIPLEALAVGAVIAGLVGVPAALGGRNTIEHFLEPSFTAEQVHRPSEAGERADRPIQGEGHEGEEGGTEEVSRGVELGLMGLSLLIALAGISLAYKFYVASPQIAQRLAERFSGAHQTLLNKYYVDELYDATVVGGTMASGRWLWAFDRKVVDGAVNGTGWATIIGSWFSGWTDRTAVDGLVNLVGRIVQASSHAFRRLQTGLVQNYALLMLFGIFAFMTVYLFVR
jgi:NADH-quinone oxidoreductase subunit L